MGNDLYWKKTPKPQDEDIHQISYSTWHFLQELYSLDDRNSLNGMELTSNDLGKLRIVLLVSKGLQRQELTEDMQELISAISKYDSITLEIHG